MSTKYLNEIDINKDEDTRNGKIKLIDKYKDIIENIDVCVKYKNGSTFYIQNNEEYEIKNITYIPQNYLNKSVENEASINVIKNKIFSILKKKQSTLRRREEKIQ